MEVTFYLKVLLVILELASTDACVPTISGSSSLNIKVGFTKNFTCRYSLCGTNQSIYWRINSNRQTDGVIEQYSTTSSTTDNITTITYNGNSYFAYSPSRPDSISQNNVVVYCFAGTRNDSVNVNVQYGPDIPTLNRTGTMDIIEYNSTPTISCKSSCNPKCTYRFWKNGSPDLSSSTGIFNKSSIRRTDSGTYTCRASNLVSHKTSTQNFIFNVLYPPVFSLTRSPSSLLEEGTPVTFTFRPTTNGNPRSYNFSQCIHTVDGKYLRDIPFQLETHQIHFVIGNVSVTDRGTYTCSVTNGIEDKSGNSIVKAPCSLDLKTPPHILMKNKTRVKDGNWTLSIDFISLHYQPKAQWIHLPLDRVAENIETISPRQSSYEIKKDKISYNIPSYLTTIKAKDPGKYVVFIENDMGKDVLAYEIISPASEESTDDAPTALIAVGSVFLVLGVICIGIALFLLYKNRQQKTKMKENFKQRHPSMFAPPSVNELVPITKMDDNQESSGIVNPAEVEISVEKQEGPYITPQNTDAAPKIIKPPAGQYRRQQDEVKNVVYENNKVQNESVKEEYITVLSPESEQVPFYETPQTLIVAKEKGKPKTKDQNPYANQKAKNRKGDVKHYANINYNAGKAYENHVPGSGS